MAFRQKKVEGGGGWRRLSQRRQLLSKLKNHVLRMHGIGFWKARKWKRMGFGKGT